MDYFKPLPAPLIIRERRKPSRIRGLRANQTPIREMLYIVLDFNMGRAGTSPSAPLLPCMGIRKPEITNKIKYIITRRQL